MAYLYTTGNIFEIPNKYEYAQCSERDYLLSWNKDRNRIRALLEHRANEKDKERSESVPLSLPENCYILQERFTRVENDFHAGLLTGEQLQKTISIYIKKYEVFNRLYAIYKMNNRKYDDSPVADLRTYIIFSRLVAEAADSQNSLKCMSTLLKIVDAIASQDCKLFNTGDAKMFLAVLDIEYELIYKLVNK